MSEYKKLKMPLWVVICGLVLSFFILTMSVDHASISLLEAQAQEVEDKEGVVKEEMVVEEKITKEVSEDEADYYLSYPGLLPDHPLYWLKMIRDRVQLLLTTKPLAKAEKLLLYSDKRLGAGWALVDGNKKELGVTTLTKAEKYLERSMNESKNLGDDGESLRFKEKLSKAVVKHGQVLRIISEKLEGEQKSVIEQMIGRDETPQEMIESEASEEEEVEMEIEDKEAKEKLIDNLETLED